MSDDTEIDEAPAKPVKKVRVRGSKVAGSKPATSAKKAAVNKPKPRKPAKTVKVKRTKPEPETAAPEPIGGNAKAALKSYVKRLNSLMDEQDNLKDDISEVMAEAKATGFNVPSLRAAMRLIRMTDEQILAARNKADEAEYIRDIAG